ncbi:30S ribosomal protein S13 [Candidatus Gracilibacteria bacterium CG17_big_fil_post_rev_8_21_14_2_50_48_13]|nr:MAG: 30S ribosomal protein S13 [Candidatus Gracilibacteria bacterium CG17_big_fil_post_rev_8_21_14_2_50_48_13]
MARVAGVTLPKNKRIEVALTYVFGIGRPTSNKILEKLQLNRDKRVHEMTEDEFDLIRNELRTMVVEGDRRREVAMNIKRLQDISCYRGYRHSRGLPVRGQRTKTNSRTRKGKRRTVANKKKEG